MNREREGGERIIVTADRLIQMFGHLEPKELMYLLSPFTAKGTDALNAFNAIIDGMKKGPHTLAQKGNIECVEHLKQAWIRMSIFEKEAIRKDLPKKVAAWVGEKGPKA